MEYDMDTIAGIPSIDVDHVMFDLDGTLISSYMDSPARDFDVWYVLPGRREALAVLRAQDIKMSVVTNQAGVAFGFNTPGDVTTKLILVAQALGFAELTIHDGDSPRYHGYTRNDGGMLTAHVAYEHPDARIERYREDPDAIDSNRRKPSPVMLIEALAGLNPGRALMVGDRPEDERTARNAGVRFVWADDFFYERQTHG